MVTEEEEQSPPFNVELSSTMIAVFVKKYCLDQNIAFAVQPKETLNS